MTAEGQKFILDYLTTYSFYEIDDFKKMREDADKILNHIQEYSRYQEGEDTFTKSKFGNISHGHTKKQVEVVIPEVGDTVWVGGQQRHFDLKFKRDEKRLEDHVRIATRIIEKGQSISCLMYIDYKQDEAFLHALNELKTRTPKGANH